MSVGGRGPGRLTFEAPETELKRWQVGLTFGGLFVASALGAASAPSGASLPIVAAVVLGALFLAVTNLWYGVLATVTAIVLLPTPFSFKVAGATVTVGRLLLFVMLVGWMMQRRRADIADKRQTTPLDFFLWVVTAAMILSTIANVPDLHGGAINAVIRKLSVFVVDFFLLFSVVAVGCEPRSARFASCVLSPASSRS